MRTIAAMAAVLLLSATRVAAQEHGRGEHRPVPDTAAHAAQTMTAGPLGIPRTREGSGTAWLPDASPMNAVHGQIGRASCREREANEGGGETRKRNEMQPALLDE